ncbi:MAG: hypothetical protein FWD01_04120 [Defluviitaleaceae bacterium]|nr:hypothetical protein [Defluviitaleaceae bacterium]
MDLNFKTKPFRISMVDKVINEDEINNSFDTALPSGIIELWKNYSEIGFENSILIYGFDIAKERNIQYETAKYVPDFLLIGDDGGGQGIFIKKSNEQLNVLYSEFGALGFSSMRSLGINLFDWLQNNPSIGDKGAEDCEMVAYMDLFVVRLPHNITKFIFDARRDFNLPLSIREIRNGLNNLPYLLKEKITLMKYGGIIKKLNETYDCLKTAKSFSCEEREN